MKPIPVLSLASPRPPLRAHEHALPTLPDTCPTSSARPAQAERTHKTGSLYPYDPYARCGRAVPWVGAAEGCKSDLSEAKAPHSLRAVGGLGSCHALHSRLRSGLRPPADSEALGRAAAEAGRAGGRVGGWAVQCNAGRVSGVVKRPSRR